MSTATTTCASSAGAARQAAVEAAILLLDKLGISPTDLAAAPRQRPEVPTFADYARWYRPW